MAPSTIVITPGAANANAYCDIVFANQYHDDRPAVKTTWNDANDQSKTAAILWATKLIDANFQFNGYVTYPQNPQFLAWPRSSLLDRNRWNYLDEATIPLEIQWMTAEFARQLLVADRTADSAIETLGITQLKLSTMELRFREYDIHAKPVPDVVASLLPAHWGYLLGKSNGTLPLERW